MDINGSIQNPPIKPSTERLNQALSFQQGCQLLLRAAHDFGPRISGEIDCKVTTRYYQQVVEKNLRDIWDTTQPKTGGMWSFSSLAAGQFPLIFDQPKLLGQLRQVAASNWRRRCRCRAHPSADSASCMGFTWMRLRFHRRVCQPKFHLDKTPRGKIGPDSAADVLSQIVVQFKSFKSGWKNPWFPFSGSHQGHWCRVTMASFTTAVKRRARSLKTQAVCVHILSPIHSYFMNFMTNVALDWWHICDRINLIDPCKSMTQAWPRPVPNLQVWIIDHKVKGGILPFGPTTSGFCFVKNVKISSGVEKNLRAQPSKGQASLHF